MFKLRRKTLISSLSLLGAIFFTGLSSAATIEERLQSLIPKSPAADPDKPAKHLPSCTTLSRGPKSGLQESLPQADATIQEIIKAIDAEKLTPLIPLFHPRLKVSSPQIAEALHDLQRTVGSPPSASIFRVWLFDTVDGSPLDLDCDQGEYRVSTHYGYDAALGVWLQIMGKGELGRLYVSLVPKGGKFYIGAWHIHQWTHMGLDSLAWQEKAAKLTGDSLKPSAFLLQDIALKLLDQKMFVQPQAAVPVRQARDKILSQMQWEEAATAIARGQSATDKTAAADAPEITAIRTALAQDGAGVNFYARVPTELSARDFESRCLTVAKRFFDNQIWKAVDGVKCHYLLQGEPIDKEGRQGGQYISRATAVLPKK